MLMAPQVERRSLARVTHFDYEYIIVGAGPAGIQMAYFLQTAGRSYIVYEANESAASFFATKPRHRKLISINKKNNLFEEDEFNLRHDWNSLLSSDKEMRFTKYSDDLYPNASDLHRYLNDFVHHFDLNIQYNTKVNKVSKQEGVFTVSTEDGSCATCRCLIMATGAVEENLPSYIEGLELADTYGTHEVSKEKYKNKMVLIIGGGNSAFETGNYLSDTAAIVHILMGRRIQFAWNTHYVGDLRAVNNNILDMYHLKSMHSTVASHVVKIRRTEKGKLVATIKDLNTQWETPGWLYFDIEYDYVISCMGWKYVKPEIFDHTIEIETCKNGRYPLLNSCWETNTENLFFIGTTMAGQDRKAASGFIHGFRYNIRTLHNILENRFYAKPLPHIQLPCKDLQAICNRIIERVSVDDSLHQMNGLLCDVIIFNEDGGTMYFVDIPRKHVMERQQFKSAQQAFVVYLDYAFDKFGKSMPIDNVHAPDFTNNRCASFMHPYIEYYELGEYVDQTELQESLIVRFDNLACSLLPQCQWRLQTNENYIKHFINAKMNWTSEEFDLIPLPQEIAEKVFVPLTEEEKARIPVLLERTECVPSQELLPKDGQALKKRILKPVVDEIMKKKHEKSKDLNGNLVLLT